MQMNYQDIFSLTAESYGSLIAIPSFPRKHFIGGFSSAATRIWQSEVILGTLFQNPYFRGV